MAWHDVMVSGATELLVLDSIRRSIPDGLGLRKEDNGGDCCTPRWTGVHVIVGWYQLQRALADGGVVSVTRVACGF